MTEEEQGAIEYLKGKFEFFDEDDTLAKWDYEAINTMLGLIDKLQIENEELKSENSSYADILNAEIKDYDSLKEKYDKLQKENEDMREELQMYVDTDVMILQKELKDSINARFELQRRIDKLQKDLENLKEVERQICCEELITKDGYQDILKENAELKEEIKDLIKENHKHIDYIADMKKKHEDKIRTKIKELESKKEQYTEQPLIYHILKSQLEELLGDE